MTKPQRRVPRLSMPGEHGGLVTLAGSALLSIIVAPDRLVAAASASVFTIGFLARGPVERAARKFRPRAWDHRAMAAYAVVTAALVALVATRAMEGAVITALGAAVIVLAGVVTVKARVHRTFPVETLALGGCGAVAGVAMYAGGVAMWPASVLGGAMAFYGAATVSLVRAEVRDLDAAGRARLSWLACGWLALGAAACAMTVLPLALAFAPRGTHALVRAVFGPSRSRILVVALRETAELLVFVGLLSYLALAG